MSTHLSNLLNTNRCTRAVLPTLADHCGQHICMQAPIAGCSGGVYPQSPTMTTFTVNFTGAAAMPPSVSASSVSRDCFFGSR